MCMEVCSENKICNFTVLHICSAHMIKLVADKVTKVKCSKRTKTFFMY